MNRFLKTTIAAVLAGAVALSFSGCGSEKEAAKANNSKEVTIYMGVVEQSAKVVAEEFEKDTGIHVNFVRMSGGETLSRIRAEKKTILKPMYGTAEVPTHSSWQRKKDFLRHTNHRMRKK